MGNIYERAWHPARVYGAHCIRKFGLGDASNRMFCGFEAIGKAMRSDKEVS